MLLSSIHSYPMLQEASEDLKTRLPKNEKELHDVTGSKISTASENQKEAAAPFETRAARASGSKPCQNLALEDEQASSEPQDFCSQDSDNEDQNIFRDRWAVRRHGKQEGGNKAERLASLPKKFAKHLEKFESEVLESIPDHINECLGLHCCTNNYFSLALALLGLFCLGLHCLALLISSQAGLPEILGHIDCRGTPQHADDSRDVLSDWHLACRC